MCSRSPRGMLAVGLDEPPAFDHTFGPGEWPQSGVSIEDDRELGYRGSGGRYLPVRCDRGERDERERALRQARMRNGQLRAADLEIAEQQQVEVQGPSGVARRQSSAAAKLEPLQLRQKILGCQSTTTDGRRVEVFGRRTSAFGSGAEERSDPQFHEQLPQPAEPGEQMRHSIAEIAAQPDRDERRL